MPTYLKTQLGTGNNFTMVQALMVTAVSLVAIIISIPLMARLSDRIGRKPVLAASAVLMALVSYPMFAMITTGNMLLACIATVVMAIAFSGHAAVVHTVLTEMFPTTVRYSAYSIGFSISTIIFGGSAPLVMTEIIKATGNSMVPAYAAIGTAIITLTSVDIAVAAATREYVAARRAVENFLSLSDIQAGQNVVYTQAGAEIGRAHV